MTILHILLDAYVLIMFSAGVILVSWITAGTLVHWRDEPPWALPSLTLIFILIGLVLAYPWISNLFSVPPAPVVGWSI